MQTFKPTKTPARPTRAMTTFPRIKGRPVLCGVASKSGFADYLRQCSERTYQVKQQVALMSALAFTVIVERSQGSAASRTPIWGLYIDTCQHTVGDDHFGSDCIGIYWPSACCARARQVDNSG